jgi:hypothetical protein
MARPRVAFAGGKRDQLCAFAHSPWLIEALQLYLEAFFVGRYPDSSTTLKPTPDGIHIT